MASEVNKLLEEALRLPPEARAALASSLMESLDETVDEDAEAEWAKEIQRRIREIESGQVKTVPWALARREILGR
ncbi:MAG: addiction module protein [Acidobacteria bacterium]|nr:addiction module protein [Acidobacteriota bacterium]